ncbi:KAP family P-loop NTPase fold protein [Bradyrhizobium yuanmingense]|uniref:KAP family P-loop NTPase fold protein n=1 Tax=Bradyrhizobium yuanmingense TaxID=108015 RepID=UPI001CD59565|nr:P-loop NTPase fold protein [Bradyrhizobium yuanmingense]MCA1529243.1 hypothetical protein [Bradyrhizobium yuanmingense]
MTAADIWTDDRLGRRADAEFLKSFLLNRIQEREAAGQPASYVLNIDAQWGEGKSFFLDRFGDTLRADGLLVADVNAWQDDHADDPLLSVMDAIDAAVAPLVRKKKRSRERWNEAKRTGAAIAVAAAKGATVQLAKKVIGAGVEDIGSILSAPPGLVDADKTADALAKALGDMVDAQGKALLASFREGKRTIGKFRESLSGFLAAAAAEGQRLPLFVLVDELDRCRPPFAIAMLERMKHLFEIDQVVFVVATDTVQLSHSVGAVYGSEFNSVGYLARFFNRTYYFQSVSRRDFVAELFARLPMDVEKISLPQFIDLETYLTGGFDFFALPLRDIEQVYDILRSVVTAWSGSLKLEMAALFPITVAYQQKFELSLNGEFASKLNRLAQRLGGCNDAVWKIQFGSADRYRGKPAETVSGVVLASDFISHGSKPLYDLNHEVTARHSQWVVQRLSDEFAIVHRHSHTPGERAPLSGIMQYPDMVRSAGRLLPRTSR